MSSKAEEIHMTENGKVLVLDSVESEKEILSILERGSNPLSRSASKDRTKLQLRGKETMKIARTWIIKDDYMLSIEGLRPGDKRVLGLMLMKKFGPNKHKIKPQLGYDGSTYVCFKSILDMKIAKKLLNTRGISNHKVTAQEVTEEKPIQGLQFDVNEYRQQVTLLNGRVRDLILEMQEIFQDNVPAYAEKVKERKLKYNGLFCEVESIRICTPKREPYHSCFFLIVEHHKTGLPCLLMRDSSGKVHKNWKKRDYYHYSIITAASIFEKLVVSSQWQAVKGPRGLWRKLIVRSNEKGELLLWIEVQSAQYSALDEATGLQILFKNYFERGIGRKCKVISAYVQVIYTDAAPKPRNSLIKMIMGRPLFDEIVCGLHIKINPQFNAVRQIARPEILCKIVQDMIMPISEASIIVIGSADSGIVGLHLAQTAGEVFFIDRKNSLRIVKCNIIKNELGSKCTTIDGVTEEELPGISLKHSEAYAFVTLPSFATAAACRVMTTLRSASTIKRIVLWLDPSKPFALILKMLADPEIAGNPFFPRKIVPFDTVLSEKHFMLVMMLDRLENQGLPLSNLVIPYKNQKIELRGKHVEFLDMREKIIQKRIDVKHSSRDADPYRKELSDAREKIKSLQRKKEQIVAELRSIDFHNRPNLVIEVKQQSTKNVRGIKASSPECQMRYNDIEYDTAESNEMVMDENGKVSKVARVVAVASNELHEAVKGDSQPVLDDDVAFYLKKVVADSNKGAGILGSKTWPIKKSQHASEDEIKTPHDVEYERENRFLSSSKISAVSLESNLDSSPSGNYEHHWEKKLIKPIMKDQVKVTVVRQIQPANDSRDSYPSRQARCYNNEEEEFDDRKSSSYASLKNERDELQKLKVRIASDQNFKRSAEIKRDLPRDSEFERPEHQSFKRQYTHRISENDFQDTENEYQVDRIAPSPSKKHARDEHYFSSSTEFQSRRRPISKTPNNDLEGSYHVDSVVFKKDTNSQYHKNDLPYKTLFEKNPYNPETDTRSSRSTTRDTACIGREFDEKRVVEKTSSYKYADHTDYEKQTLPQSGIDRRDEDMHNRKKYLSRELSPVSKRVKSTEDYERGNPKPKERRIYPSDGHSYPADPSCVNRKLALQNSISSKESDTHFYQQEKNDRYDTRETYSGKRKLCDGSCYESLEKTYKRPANEYYISSTKDRDVLSSDRPVYKKRVLEGYSEVDINPQKEKATGKRNFPLDGKEHVHSYKVYANAPVEYGGSEHRKEKTWISDERERERESYPGAYSKETSSTGAYLQKTMGDRSSNQSRYSHPENIRETSTRQMQYDAAGHYSQSSDFSYTSKVNYDSRETNRMKVNYDNRETSRIKDTSERQGYDHHNRSQLQSVSEFSYSHPKTASSLRPSREVPLGHEPNSRQHMLPKLPRNWERQH